MPSMLVVEQRDAILRWLSALRPDMRPRWGLMSPSTMVCHLIESARMALGELAVKPRRAGAFRTFPLKHLLLYVVPFPKGAPTAPELLAGRPGELEADRARLTDLLLRIGTGPSEGPGPVHPLFGPLSRREWGVLVRKHTDHHLRQFGL